MFVFHVTVDIWNEVRFMFTLSAFKSINTLYSNILYNKILLISKIRCGFSNYPAGTGRTMYVHCTNCTYNVRTLYVQ